MLAFYNGYICLEIYQNKTKNDDSNSTFDDKLRNYVVFDIFILQYNYPAVINIFNYCMSFL